MSGARSTHKRVAMASWDEEEYEEEQRRTAEGKVK
jgi:hypothetical protein